jgi:hypothetical protein
MEARRGDLGRCLPPRRVQAGDPRRKLRRGLAEPWSFRWSFRQARHHITGPYLLDGAPDLSSEDGIQRDGVDGGGSTSNPALGPCNQ